MVFELPCMMKKANQSWSFSSSIGHEKPMSMLFFCALKNAVSAMLNLLVVAQQCSKLREINSVCS